MRWQFLGDLENRSWDWRVRWTANAAHKDPRIKIILIDQTSLERRASEEGQYWPWPRSLYNPVLLYLKQAGAKVIGFDTLYTEYSSYVKDDAKFAKALGSTLPTVLSVALRTENVEHDPKALALFKQRQIEANGRTKFEEAFLAGLPKYTLAGITLPIIELIETATSFGNVTASADSDQIYRHALPGVYFDTTPVLSLPFAVFSLANPNFTDGSAITRFADDDGRYVVRFHGPAGTYPSYSIDAIIQSWVQLSAGKTPQVPLEEFKDSYVLLGASALGLFDVRPTPFAGNYPGVELNATILDNLLQQNFFKKVPLFVSILVSGLGIMLIAVVSLFVTRTRFWGPTLAGLFAVMTLTAFALAFFGWWLPMAAPITGMLLCLLGSLTFLYELEGRQRRFLKDAFAYYVSREVIDKIVEDPEKLSLGGERRDLTIFFNDIVGFTSLSESMEPSQLVQLLNRFLSEMSAIILESNGTIDKYQGDAIIAFWNAPLDVPDHHERAVSAALECQKRLSALAGEFRDDFGREIKMRIGLNSGPVNVGNFGSDTRFNYTVIGDTANLASRLEGANKVFGTRILVSEMTRAGAEEAFLWRKVGDIRVLGRKKAVAVYEPLQMGTHTQLIENLDTWNVALDAFEHGNLEEALEGFSQLTSDSPAAAYVRRIETIQAENRREDPWDPVWMLTEK